MIERIKNVLDENGLEYETLINKRQFYAEQNESAENGKLMSLAMVSESDTDVKVLYEFCGQRLFIKDPMFFNYVTNVCLYQIRKGFAYNCKIEEQDKEDFQMQAYATLYELFTTQTDTQYSFEDFNLLCNSVANRVMKKITYAYHRFEMDSSFNLTKVDDNGITTKQTLDEVMAYHNNRNALEVARTERVYARGINSLELLEELGNCLTYDETANLKKLLSIKVDKTVLSSSQRKQLSRINAKIQKYVLECNLKAKDYAKASKQIWIELLDAQKQDKKAKRQAHMQEVNNSKLEKSLKAQANLDKSITMALTRISSLKHKASQTAFISTLQQLIDLERSVRNVTTNTELKALRKVANQCSYDLQGLDTEQVSNLKSINASAKALVNGY
jgi:hypothetical protein